MLCHTEENQIVNASIPRVESLHVSAFETSATLLHNCHCFSKIRKETRWNCSTYEETQVPYLRFVKNLYTYCCVNTDNSKYSDKGDHAWSHIWTSSSAAALSGTRPGGGGTGRGTGRDLNCRKQENCMAQNTYQRRIIGVEPDTQTPGKLHTAHGSPSILDC